MSHTSYFAYLGSEGAELFTLVCLPGDVGQYPTVVFRTPYVDIEETLPEEEIAKRRLAEVSSFLAAGYAVVLQHCRGRGKSSGDCIPYINEREDGLLLLDWIRTQAFYNGEIYLCGASYTSSVHYVTAPFAPDIKGAVLEVQDAERYNCNYRNGFFKVGLHGNWYVSMYKKKSGLVKSYTADTYRMLPLSAFSETVFGECAPDLDGILGHPDRDDPFWKTRAGGGEAHNAIVGAAIPILLVTGFFDIYTGGVFDMWRSLDEKTRSLSALAVHPYDHSGTPNSQPIPFPGGTVREAFGDYRLRWLDAIRGKGGFPFPRGQVTYYPLFGDGYCTDAFHHAAPMRRIPLGEGSVTYKYNPYAPASFRGGLSANFGGTAWQDPPHTRYDIVTCYTPPFAEDTKLRGQMTASLRVMSDCEDTCFYLRLSLCKEEGDYGLRDDITKISNVAPDYVPGEEVTLSFRFDEIALCVKAGERLRIDISSSAFPHYVPHTNLRGLFSEQTVARVATNTVRLADSYLELPICTEGGVEQ